MVCTGDAVSQLPHRMPSTPQVLPTASPAGMQSAGLSGCSRGLDLGVDVGRRRHGWASGTMQISAEVAVSGAMGMGILLATLEATVQYVPLSDQGILPWRLSRTLCRGATRVCKSVEGALLEVYWWCALAMPCHSSPIGCHRPLKYSQRPAQLACSLPACHDAPAALIWVLTWGVRGTFYV